MKVQHKIAALVVCGALALSGCTNDGDNEPTPTPSTPDVPSQLPTPDGPSTPHEPMTKLASLDQITVTGDFGAPPQVSAPYPFQVEQTMDKVLVQGSGATIADASMNVELHYVGINARSGQQFDSSFDRGEPVVFPLDGVIKGFSAGLIGKQQGSRVLIAMTSGDGYDPAGQPSIDILPGDNLMFVVDIVRVPLSAPAGQPVAAPADMPTVTEADGVPAITVPAALPRPTQPRVAPLIQGSGPQLSATGKLTSHAVCVTWDGTEIYNDYRQKPATDAGTGRAMKSLWAALVGQAEGSRVLVELPGDQAYPNGSGNPSVAPGTPIACVVDLLFVEAAAGR